MLSIYRVHKTLMNYWSVKCRESAQQTWPQSLCDGHACDNELLKRLSLLLDQVEGPEYEELTALHDSVYQQSVSWFASLQDHMKEQILSHFGLMPDREPEPQVYCPFFFYHAVISCRNVLRHIMLRENLAVPAMLFTPLWSLMNQFIYQQPKEAPGIVACAFWSKAINAFWLILHEGNLFSLRNQFILIGCQLLYFSHQHGKI